MKRYYIVLSVLCVGFLQAYDDGFVVESHYSNSGKKHKSSTVENSEIENARRLFCIAFFRTPDAYFNIIEEENRTISRKERLACLRAAAIKRGNFCLK